MFCNALVPTCLALAAAYYSGGVDLALGQAPAVAAAAAGISPATLTRMLTALHGAFLGYYACCCGDTWSSELGQLRWVVYPGMVCVHGAWEQSGRVGCAGPAIAPGVPCQWLMLLPACIRTACSPEEPRLITNLRPVRRGTNGGVTLLGLGASLAGGLAMGATFCLATLLRCAGGGGIVTVAVVYI